jgi:hypothetical protein
MTAVPLALLLVATLAVLVALTPGAFSFDSWPTAPKSALSEREVVVDVPIADRPTTHADARRAPATERDGSSAVVEAPERALERPRAPAAPRAEHGLVAEGPRRPEAHGDGVSPTPVPLEAKPEEASSPDSLPAAELPALPQLPAKDLPELPDQSTPEWDDDGGVLPRRVREEDQE